MAAFEIVALDPVVPQLRAPGASDTYTFPRAITSPLTLTGGTVTTSTPLLDVTQTWNAGGVTFTGLKLNVTDTASASASLLMDFQLGGASRFTFRKDGQLAFSSATASAIIDPTGLVFNRAGTGYVYNQNASGSLGIGVSNSVYGLLINSAGSVGFVNAAGTATLQADAANILALRNGTAAQAFRVYNTWTDASNGEWGAMRWNSNVLEIGSFANGTGNARLVLLSNNNVNLGLSSASTVIFTLTSTTRNRLAFSNNSSLEFVDSVERARFAAGTGEFLINTINPTGGSTKLTVSGGASVFGGTVTASDPVLNLTQTWNNAGVTFTGLKLNVTDTASAAASLLMDLQVGGSSKLSVDRDGNLKLRNLIATQYVEGQEMTAPAAPAANGFRIYAEDNGSGKTRLMCLFATGAAQQLAIEP